MRFARPPEGFAVILSESAQKSLAAARPTTPRIDEIWSGVAERLRFTAHREGVVTKAGDRIWQIDADPSFGIPRLAVVYRVLGDAVTVIRILVSLQPSGDAGP